MRGSHRTAQVGGTGMVQLLIIMAEVVNVLNRVEEALKAARKNP
jgi:hypothetical protein